eukprot:5215478-Ditylum_brightwellii.AAC.1
MPLLHAHRYCGGNENSGRSKSPPSCNVFSQKESEEEETRTPLPNGLVGLMQTMGHHMLLW